GWIADYPDPQDWVTLQFGLGQASNNWNYGNNNCTCAAAQKANQTAMTAADANSDPTARAAAYNKIEQELVNEVAWLSMFQSPTARLRKSYVVGFTPNAQGSTPPQDWGNIYITAH
ncbi:MAG: peptide ABC transporter substrate-binding protein, partial [Chloroflexota bacterium]|nr:peptide ABC transporter substrate-binding protein [Chloroflexota bacterium]